MHLDIFVCLSRRVTEKLLPRSTRFFSIMSSLRGRPELSSFAREYTERVGVSGRCTLFKMLIMMHCIFIPGR